MKQRYISEQQRGDWQSRRQLPSVTARDNSSEVQGQTVNHSNWIDTAFDGHFVFPSKLIEELGLETLVETEAILADGTVVTLETFVAYLDWFGDLIPVQVVANEGKFPLLGTALLEKRRLTIDYLERTLDLG